MAWALLPIVGLASASPAIDWASQPVRANETVLLLGGPFTSASSLTVGGSQGEATVAVLQPSEASVKFVVPPGQALAQWPVTVDGGAAYVLNGPQPWWVGGDLRQHASAGGFVRVFGSCVHVQSDAAAEAAAELQVAEAGIQAALGDDTTDVESASTMAALQRLGTARRAHAAAAAASASVLRLTPTTGNAAPIITVMSDAANSTRWAAWFTLPSSAAPGEYSVAIANGLDAANFVALGAFGSYVGPSAQESNVTTIRVIGAAEETRRKPWKHPAAKVFDVTAYGPHGLPGCGGNGAERWACPLDPLTGKRVKTQLYWANASVAIEKALAAAGAAGGGIVFFPRGTYFVNSSFGFDVPWGVKLEGEGKDLVQIIFSETYSVCSSQCSSSTDACSSSRWQCTNSHGPGSPFSGATALFRGPSTGSGGWAVSDLTMYMTAYHNAMFYVSHDTHGFEMQRVRVTLNSFFGGNGPGMGRSPTANISWGLRDPGDLLVMIGTDWLLEDCDLFSDGTVLTSVSRPGYCTIQRGNRTSKDHCHGSAWGIARNNRFFNGGSSHFMPQWKQIIFENNTITGISPIAGGQSMGTGPGGGRLHHIYHAKNKIQFVWGNDREIVTFDDAGSAYLGRVAAVSADGRTLTLAADARSSLSGEWLGWDGAAVSVLNGTGAGTWRRVSHSGIDATAHPGEFSNPENRTWEIDRPFAVSLTEGQVISITPARSRVIFEQDHFQDGGTLQFYGQAQEIVVDGLVGERIAGLVAWGQWRGWYEPKCGTMGMRPCPPPVDDHKRVQLGGEMGNGIMMNTQLSYLNNRILEGNKIVRWSAMGGGSYVPGFEKFYNGAVFSIQGVEIKPSKGTACKSEPGGVCHDWSSLAATSAVIFRNNVALSNGGFSINGGRPTVNIRDVVIEDNTIERSDADKAMQIAPVMTGPNGSCIVRNNALPT